MFNLLVRLAFARRGYDRDPGEDARRRLDDARRRVTETRAKFD
jgi:hypothetical protein